MAIVRVQSASGNTGTTTTATSFTVTLPGATTSGNTLVVAVIGSQQIAYKVSSAHGIFSMQIPAAIDATSGTCVVQVGFGIMTGADTVITIARIDASSMSQTVGIVAEYSGISASPDALPVIDGAIGTNAANTNALTNTNVNALYVGIIGVKTQTASQNSNWAFNNVAPFSIVAQNSTNNNSTSNVDRAAVFLDAIVSTSASRIANINHGFGTNRYAGLLATFGQSVSAGGGLRTAGHGGLAS